MKDETKLRQAAIGLLNQLALLLRDDETTLWIIGGRGLDEAYQALKNAVAATDSDPPAYTCPVCGRAAHVLWNGICGDCAWREHDRL